MQLDDLEEILEQARISNATTGITGALVYIDGVFLQILEGESGSVMALMARIAADLRHEAVTVLQEAEIPAAIFSEWQMAYVSATPQQIAQWAGLSGTAAIPEIIADLRQDSLKVSRFAHGILSLLAAEPGTQSEAESK